MLSNKKYYIISEVADILNLPLYKLRYLEKSKQRLKIHKVNKRRYYTQEDIDFLKKYYKLGSSETVDDINIMSEDLTNTDACIVKNYFINKIDDLITKLNLVKEQLNHCNN